MKAINHQFIIDGSDRDNLVGEPQNCNYAQIDTLIIQNMDWIDQDDIDEWLEIFPRLSHVSTIKFINNDMGVLGFNDIVRIFWNVKTLDLTCNLIDVDCITQLSILIKFNTTIHDFLFIRNNVEIPPSYVDGFSILHYSILQNKAIQCLIVGFDNDYPYQESNPHCFNYLNNILNNNSTIQEVTWMSADDKKVGVGQVSKFVDHLYKLNSCFLIALFTPESLDLLTDGISSNDTLHTVGIGSLNKESMDTKFLAKIINTNKTIKHICFSGVFINQENIHLILDALKENQTIQQLKIKNNKLGNEGIKLVARFLTNNTKIIDFDLEDNKFTDEGGNYLLEMLRYNTTLQYMDVRNNNLSDSMVENINNLLERNKILQPYHQELEKIIILQRFIHHRLWRPHGPIAQKLFEESFFEGNAHAAPTPYEN